MTKTHRKAATATDEAFNRHYAAVWGQERWQKSLYPALAQQTRYACLLNRYAPLPEAKKLIADENLEPLHLPRSAGDIAANCFVKASNPSNSDANNACDTSGDAIFPPPQAASNGLLSHWNLDAASVLVASMLDVKPGENVLDLCAAPGGKSITLAQQIWPHLHADDSTSKQRAASAALLRAGTLHSNEADGPRQRRLADNLALYLPRSLFVNKQAAALRVDGSMPNAEYELRVKTSSGTIGYDKILVDAPCSSERHIIHAHVKASASGRIADEMANWRPGSSKRLAKTQLDLLMTALKAVRVGGTVVYATCSIETMENDGVVAKALAQVVKERKKSLNWDVRIGFNGGIGDEALETDLKMSWAEKTKYGWIVLPDHRSGGRWGPLFFAVLTKVG